jgi:hypothetical protein
MATFPIGALIIGTRITIVFTLGVTVVMDAAGFRITVIFCARIVVITVQRNADANSLFTLVFIGALIIIHTDIAGGGGEQASFFPCTFVVGAIIFIITQLAFIQVAVTVVVHTVAGFIGRCLGRALGQTIFRTHPPAGTGAMLIFNEALGLQFLGSSIGRAGAFPILPNALMAGQVFDRLHFLASVVRRAVRVFFTA